MASRETSAPGNQSASAELPPLRIVVAPHDLDVGGSQINAIELAAVARDLGHDVTVAGPAGALVERVLGLGLPFAELPRAQMSTGPSYAKALAAVAGDVQADIVHSYEGTGILWSWWDLHLRRGIPVIGTVNSMSVPNWVPRKAPLIVCTPLIAAENAFRARVWSCEIPTDLRPATLDVDGTAFRAALRLDPDELLVTVVTRLAPELKLEGVLDAIEAAGLMADQDLFRLAVVGDGPSRAVVDEAAAAVNTRAGREVVTVVGELLDPRPAYAGSDVCLGMGGSLLRGLAFGRPSVVQGEGGFWCMLTAETAGQFSWRGFYGIADGSLRGADVLVKELTPLVRDAALRREVGAWGRALVGDRYDLDQLGADLVQIYREVIANPGSRVGALADSAKTAGLLGRWAVGRRRLARRGGDVFDEGNGRRAIETGIRAPVPPEYARPLHLRTAAATETSTQ